ncbi:MAG: GNAT family N-acetyltransferase [Myxococcales bacterium]|nr:GNAT family N-acetyltransferase [Myxococcales bacterium]
MKFDLRYLGAEEYPRLAAFIAEHWGPDHPYVKRRALFDWTFRRGELWDREGYSWLYAEDGGTMISSLGAIPFELNIRGKTVPAVWPVTWMTAEAYRHTGVGLWLFGMLRRPPFKAIVCFGAREAAADIYRALRFQMVDDIPRRVALLSQRQELATRLLEHTHPDWAPSRVDAVTRFYSPNWEPGSSTRVDIADFWSRWDDHGWQAWAPELVGAKRDARYLAWRYRDHPEVDYQILAVEDDGRIGLLVWRLEPVHIDRDMAMGSFARIVELLPASPSNARALLSTLWSDLSALPEVIGADYYNYHGLTGGWLAEAGMALSDAHPDGQGIPSGFQPIDRRCKPIPNAVWIRHGKGPSFPFDPGDAWYWTKSDSDRDVPIW